ncbi:MAG: 2-oxoacid:acceptor oxidoreductase family protein [Thermoplasmata archaeon]
MIEVRFHGRGGQGAVIASNILADAAFKEGKDVMAFPYFGVERRGAPVTAFTRIDNKKIRIRSEIYEPDYVVVLDESLVHAIDVAKGLKENGKILINSQSPPEAFKKMFRQKVYTVDATQIAINNALGSKQAPIVNTAILGAVAKAFGIVKIDSVVNSIALEVPVKIPENQKAAREAFESVKE